MSMIPEATLEAAAEPTPVGRKVIQGRSPWQLAWERLRTDRAAIISATTIAVIVLLALLAPLIAHWLGHGPNQQFVDIGEDENGNPIGPNGTFWLGTDSSARDLFVRIIYGARISLSIGVLATLVSIAIGTVFGLAAGYLGGVADALIARLIDVMLAVPFLVIAIAVASIWRPGFWLVIFVVGVLGFSYPARIVRGQVISLKEKEFVQAARALGAGPLRVMFVDLLPNVVAQVIVYGSLLIPAAIVSEATLSYLGVGIQAPTADWGAMISDAQGYYQYGFWWYLLFPCLALIITTLAFNILGDSVRDALDPRGGGVYK
jgi:ABC-type dipeptide/oligopeptide/nickel transport system permease subunit